MHFSHIPKLSPKNLYNECYAIKGKKQLTMELCLCCTSVQQNRNSIVNIFNLKLHNKNTIPLYDGVT